jgi:hypothetical protein
MMVDQEEQPQEQTTNGQETDGTEKPTAARIEIETGDVEGSAVTAAGRDVVYSGNVIVNVNVGTTSGEPEMLAKEIAKNVSPAVAEAVKERKREEKLEEQVAEYATAAESLQDLPEVERWFREDLSTAHEKYFAIALSLFNGLKWADFWDIYQAILKSRDLLVDENDKKGAHLFEQTDEELVNSVRARIVRKEDQAAEVVEFKEEIYPRVILELLRTKYRPRLVELLPGLGKLGEHPYWEIRARAAYAVAEIGKLDFYRARRQVLEVWARDDRPYVRAAVGYTAHRLIQDGIADTEVRKMLDEWADPKESRGWKFRWAAAAAHKQVGKDHPNIALPSLKLVARNDDIRVADAVIYALLVISFDDKLKAVLSALKEWLDEDTGSKTEPNVVPLVATLSFLTLGNAYTSRAEHEPDDGEEQEDDCFLALLTADTEGTWRAVVSAALSRALKYRLADEAFDVLKGWARQVQDSDVRLAAVRDMIADWYMTLWHDGHQIGMTGTLNRLKRWIQGKDKAVRKVAQVTIAEIRQRVDAVPLSVPPPGNSSEKSITFGT